MSFLVLQRPSLRAGEHAVIDEALKIAAKAQFAVIDTWCRRSGHNKDERKIGLRRARKTVSTMPCWRSSCSNPAGRTKSVVFSDEGLEKAKQLYETLFVNGGILGALKASPLIGSELDLSRPREEGRKVDI